MRAGLLLSFALMACVVGLQQYQKDSLWGLYTATNGQWWSPMNGQLPNNWNYSTDPCDPPGWSGVGCDIAKDNVVDLSITSMNLSGTLPDLLLPELSTL